MSVRQNTVFFYLTQSIKLYIRKNIKLPDKIKTDEAYKTINIKVSKKYVKPF